MRTALLLLLLLALAAVPGSLLPQRPLNPVKVDQYLADHATIGPLLDRFGFFDVFAAPWFAAIYLLLFISLIGCLVPRVFLYLRSVRAKPVPAPRHLERLAESAKYERDGVPQELATQARTELEGKRWRVAVRAEPRQGMALSAEKGYLSEIGNLVFHIALTVLLVGIGIGHLWGYQGTVVVQEGQGFCNTVLQFDSFKPGRLVKNEPLAPFCVDLEDFTATYEADGTAANFRARIDYSHGDSTETREYPLEVNSPLRIEGIRLYLLNHGYSPEFRIRTPSGQTFENVTAPFIPQDENLTSEGVLKLPDAAPAQLAIEGVFAPAATISPDGFITSGGPQAVNPAIAIFVYRGNLGLDTGRPQSVYSIDREQVRNGQLTQVDSAVLLPGQQQVLDDGTEITFLGFREWASVQVSRDPGQTLVLGSAIAALAGLLLLLIVRRRRVWIRFTPSDSSASSGRTVIEVGGLARTEAGSFGKEFAQLVTELRGAGTEPEVTKQTIGK